MTGFTLDYAEVSELGRRLKTAQRMAPERLDHWLHDIVGPRLLANMRAEAPERSGRLRASLRQVDSPGAVAVGTQGVEYVKFVLEGTRPHEIRPKAGGVLSFQVGGTRVFATVVHHPGTKADDFMKRAADKTMRESLALLNGLAFGRQSDVRP